jgi:hypothetical protein
MNGLKWKVGENGSWNYLESFPFVGNKINLPPFINQILPINPIKEDRSLELDSCKTIQTNVKQ